MKVKPRPVGSLTADDFAKFPVWRFVGSDTPDETFMKPVRRLPVRRLIGCIVGTSIRLGDGTVLTGVLGNIDLTDPRFDEHFRTLSVFRADGAQFRLARYHDHDAKQRGPKALASFLGVRLSAVFPITYDLTRIAIGPAEVLHGTITAVPRERLTRQQIIGLAVPRAAE